MLSCVPLDSLSPLLGPYMFLFPFLCSLVSLQSFLLYSRCVPVLQSWLFSPEVVIRPLFSVFPSASFIPFDFRVCRLGPMDKPLKERLYRRTQHLGNRLRFPPFPSLFFSSFTFPLCRAISPILMFFGRFDSFPNSSSPSSLPAPSRQKPWF